MEDKGHYGSPSHHHGPGWNSTWMSIAIGIDTFVGVWIYNYFWAIGRILSKVPFLCFLFTSLSLLLLHQHWKGTTDEPTFMKRSFNDKRRVALPFSLSCPSLSCHGWQLPFAQCSFFLADRMERQRISTLWHQDGKDMYLDQRFGVRDYEKHGETLAIFYFWSTHFSVVDFVAIALLNITTRSPTPFCLLLLTLCMPLVGSSLLHSPGHHTRLAIPSPVHTFAASPFLHIAFNIVSFTQ
jgi:hypothetical protein